MAVTLVDYLKQVKKGNDPLSAGFIMDLLRYSDLFKVVKFRPTKGLKVAGTRWQSLPTSAFRKLGGNYTESSGKAEDINETLALLGGEVKIDRIFGKVQDVLEDPLTTQMKMMAKSVAFNFNNAFINGSQVSDPDTFEGIKVRVSNMPSRMTIDLASSGDSLKVLASSTTEHAFIDALHDAIKYVDGATHILVNETVYLGLGKVARRLNLYQQITDILERKWDSFQGVPYIDMGLKSDKSTEIITNTEDPGDGGNDSTSLYVVRMDDDDGLTGIELNGTSPEAYDPLNGSEMDTGPQMLRRVDWAVGLYNVSQYCICRVKGFKMAAS